jgi:hypothetical protein
MLQTFYKSELSFLLMIDKDEAIKISQDTSD